MATTELPLSSTSSASGGSATAEVEVDDAELLLSLAGPGATRLAILEREYGIAALVRGSVIHLQGTPERVADAERLLAELLGIVQRGAVLGEADVVRAIGALRDYPEVRLRDVFQDVVVTASRGKQIAPRGIAQKLYVQAIRDNDVVFGAGPAGTGKTYLAVAMAVAALQEQRITRIVLTRPAVEAGEKLGFLPGDLAEKVNPYLRPLYDALHDMMPAERVAGLMQRGAVEVAPLAFMRGRTLSNSFVILDEAQNTTVPQMRMFLTRLGLGSKAVITGDVTQVDLPNGTTSGLRDAISLLSNTEGIRCCTFTDVDVVRHPLVQRIVRAYDSRDAERHRGDGEHR